MKFKTLDESSLWISSLPVHVGVDVIRFNMGGVNHHPLELNLYGEKYWKYGKYICKISLPLLPEKGHAEYQETILMGTGETMLDAINDAYQKWVNDDMWHGRTKEELTEFDYSKWNWKNDTTLA